jgi:hypothetical protein
MSVSPTIRITSDGSWRVCSDGSVRIVRMLVASDIAGVIDIYFPGIVVQRNLTEAVGEWLSRYGAVSDADVPAILALANTLLDDDVVSPYVPTTQDHYAGLPPYPTGLTRFPDANPAPDGWSIVTDEKVVRGGP